MAAADAVVVAMEAADAAVGSAEEAGAAAAGSVEEGGEGEVVVGLAVVVPWVINDTRL